MKLWIPTALLVAGVALLGVLLIIDGRPSSEGQTTLVVNVDRSQPSIVVCEGGAVWQHVIGAEPRARLFDGVDCSQVSRWQFDASFERLLTVEPVGEARHVFVTQLGGSSFDLTAFMGLASTFERTIDHRHPRFDPMGRVMIVDGDQLLVVDPTSGSFEAIVLPEDFGPERWDTASQCQGEPSVAQLSTQLLTMCPWGWFDPEAPSEPLFFIREADPPVLVALAAKPPTMVETELAGDFGPCRSGDPRFYWVSGRLLCQGDGLGVVDYDLDAGRFLITPILEPGDRSPRNAIIDRSGTSIYFTTGRQDGPGSSLWRVGVTESVPEMVGPIGDGASSFTLLDAW